MSVTPEQKKLARYVAAWLDLIANEIDLLSEDVDDVGLAIASEVRQTSNDMRGFSDRIRDLAQITT